MQYLIFDEHGQAKIVDDIKEDELDPFSWPVVIRLAEIGCGLIQAEKYCINNEWVNLDET